MTCGLIMVESSHDIIKTIEAAVCAFFILEFDDCILVLLKQTISDDEFDLFRL